MKKYIYIVVSIVLISAIGNSIYQQINKKSAKSARLECHKNSTVFEKLAEPKLLEKLQNDINDGRLAVSIEVEKSKYMQSKLFNFVDENDIKNSFEKLVAKDNLSKKGKSSVNILIYENDKKDPGKKTAKSKLYAGYLVFSYKVNNTLVYKLQIDFFDEKGTDISKVLSCALKSILTVEK